MKLNEIEILEEAMKKYQQLLLLWFMNDQVINSHYDENPTRKPKRNLEKEAKQEGK